MRLERKSNLNKVTYASVVIAIEGRHLWALEGSRSCPGGLCIYQSMGSQVNRALGYPSQYEVVFSSVLYRLPLPLNWNNFMLRKFWKLCLRNALVVCSLIWIFQLNYFCGFVFIFVFIYLFPMIKDRENSRLAPMGVVGNMNIDCNLLVDQCPMLGFLWFLGCVLVWMDQGNLKGPALLSGQGGHGSSWWKVCWF